MIIITTTDIIINDINVETVISTLPLCKYRNFFIYMYLNANGRTIQLVWNWIQ